MTSWPGIAERGRRQALHVLPVDDVHGAAATEPAVRAHRDPRHQPVAGARLFDAEIDHDHVDARQFGQLGIVDAHPGVEDLRQREHLAGPLGEPAQAHVAGVQRDRPRLDRRHPQHRNENPPARGQFDDQAEHAGLLADEAETDDDVADPADRLTVRPSTTRPASLAAYTLLRRHAVKARGSGRDTAYRPRRTCLSVPGSSKKMIDKAKGLPADEVFLDLEDAVAAAAKAGARAKVAAALNAPGWAGQLRVVRVNDWTTPWTYADVIAVVAGGRRVDAFCCRR